MQARSLFIHSSTDQSQSFGPALNTKQQTKLWTAFVVDRSSNRKIFYYSDKEMALIPGTNRIIIWNLICVDQIPSKEIWKYEVSDVDSVVFLTQLNKVNWRIRVLKFKTIELIENSGREKVSLIWTVFCINKWMN